MSAQETDVTVVRTLVVCDLVGSTRLLQRLGDQRAADVFRKHDQIARDLMVQFEGREIDKTDGFLILFAEPSGAVTFALKYHSALSRLSAGENVPLDARVGVHTGEVILRTNRPELVMRGAKPIEVEGLAKPIAARLMSLARERQTLLTRAAFDAARAAIVDSGDGAIQWITHGTYLLMGLPDPIEVLEVGVEGIAPLAKPPDSDKALAVSSVRLPSIVVPPFELLSGEENRHISYGLADEIATGLSRVHSLRVISRSAAAQIKGGSSDVRAIGRELNVRYVLEGALQTVGRSVRLSAKLVETSGAEVVWADTYRGSYDDVFDIQERVSREVVDALRVKLTPDESARLGERAISNAQAFDLYLRAKQEIVKFTAEGLEQALQYLNEASSILGDNVLLIATTGYVYWQYVNAGISSDPTFLNNARDCGDRILRLEPDSPHGHRLLGLVDVTCKNTKASVVHLEKALGADPNDPDALLWLSLIYGFTGRPSNAIPLTYRLLSIDPLTPFFQMLPGFLALMNGDIAGAVQPFWKSHKADPSNPIVAVTYGQILIMNGRLEEARVLLRSVSAAAPQSFFGKMAAVYLHAIDGERDSVKGAVAGDFREAARGDFQYSWSVAECFALVGELDEAVYWVENAITQGFWNYPVLAKHDPLLAGIRGLPGFAKAAENARTLWEDFGRFQPIQRPATTPMPDAT